MFLVFEPDALFSILPTVGVGSRVIEGMCDKGRRVLTLDVGWCIEDQIKLIPSIDERHA